ncbi:MAG: hypothetical protein DCC71_17240 [Proteobacteria bacterium]|nr:MAG: hypothetical protein DCC71_17240 [Pseudomonadota bacterium]
MRTFEQWECPPLRAWISRQQCDSNRQRVTVAGEGDELKRIWLRECVKCNGVQWWSQQTGRSPRKLEAAVLAASSAEAETRKVAASNLFPDLDRRVAGKKRKRFFDD